MIILINAIEIYKEIISDLHNHHTNTKISHLNRSILFKNKIRIIFLVDSVNEERTLAVLLPVGTNVSVLNRFPKWKGANISVNKINSYINLLDTNDYVILSQAHGSDEKIFEIVINDIVNELSNENSFNGTVSCLVRVLNKWKRFFDFHSTIELPEHTQQGLFGELLVLKQLISAFGEKAVEFWSGAEKETHDFYVNGHAIEIKTSSLKDSEKIRISSEYQLDTEDVDGNLYLYVNFVRRSTSDGQKLSDLVEIIDNMISEQTRTKFHDKLFNYGYIVSCGDKYTCGFHLRSTNEFEIEQGFPCITKSLLPQGVSDIAYSIDLNLCNDFKISWEDILTQIKEDSSDE